MDAVIPDNNALSHTNSQPLRVLLAGYWHCHFYEQALADGFQACGIEVVPFKLQPFFPLDLWSRIEKKTLRGPRMNRLNRELLKTAVESNPDIVLLFRPNYIYPSTVLRIREKCKAVLVSYNHDNAYEDGERWLLWRHYHRLIQHCDVNLFPRDSDIEHAISEGVPNPNVMRFMYIKGLHRPLSTVPSEFRNEVVFVGHYEPDGRDADIVFLLENGVPLRIYGSEWHRTTQQRIREQNPQILRGEDYVRSLAGAKIALVFLSSRNKDMCTTRCLEIPACGTMMLAPRNPLLQTMYEEDKEAVYFGSREELLDKIRFYLANDSERERIAAAGYRRCMAAECSNVDRARQIAAHAERVKGAALVQAAVTRDLR